jgi:hypothetical protein
MRIGILLVASLFICSCAFAEAKTEPTNFEECLKGPHMLTKSQPPKCVTHSGKMFENSLEAKSAECVDRCGDDACDETVCMGTGCPCAESHASCPKDCPPPM